MYAQNSQKGKINGIIVIFIFIYLHTWYMNLRKLKRIIFSSNPLNIRRNEIVLEIGSGQNPQSRSDILLDKYLFDNTERSFGQVIIIDRSFVVGDAMKLPFKDKSIDYTICKHVLEHLETPKQFFEELMRVSKRGYIETPTELAEKMFGWKFHKWYINKIRDKIVLTSKEKVLYSQLFYNIFHKKIREDKYLKKFYQKNPNLFIMSYEWNKRIKYEINGGDLQPIEFETAKLDYNYLEIINRKIKISIKRRIYLEFKKIVKIILYGKRKLNLYSIIACPECKQSLIKKMNILVCIRCQKEYKIIQGIPILL